jgi:DNA-binding transcriptional MocR family regulator
VGQDNRADVGEALLEVVMLEMLVGGPHVHPQPIGTLGDRYKVSRNTVRLALGLLTNEGIITSTPGRGTFVRDRIMLTYHASRAEVADRPDDWHTDAYFTEVRQQGRQPSQRTVGLPGSWSRSWLSTWSRWTIRRASCSPRRKVARCG